MEGVIGEVRLFGGNFAPNGWAFCNGQTLPISQYEALYSVIGTTYGGDGQQSFAVPNLCGRFAVGTGNGNGLSPRTIGETGGAPSVTLTAANLPAHAHTASGSVAPGANSADGDANTPVGNFPANYNTIKTYASGTPDVKMGQSSVAVTVQPTGGGQPFDIVQPYLALNFIICLDGIFPSRS